MKIHFAAFAVITLASFVRSAFADVSIGTGRIEAPVLVSGITAVGTAMAEAKKKPEPTPTPETSPKPVSMLPLSNTDPSAPLPAPLRAKLPSKLEFVADAYRIVDLSDVFKQTSLSAEARYQLTDTLQIGASAAIRVQGNDINRDIAAQLLIGPVLNFGSDEGIRNAFFFSPKLGLTGRRETVNGAVSKSGFEPTMSLSIGKRFALSQTLSYAPSLGMVKQDGYAPAFVAVPIAFSLFF